MLACILTLYMTAYSDDAANGKLGGDYVPGIGACMTVYQVQFKNMNPFFANAPLHSVMRFCRYMFSTAYVPLAH